MSEIPKTSEFEQTHQEMAALLRVESDEDFTVQSEEYIEDRLAQLESSSTVTEIDAVNSEHTGFIHPDTIVSPFMMGNGFRVNDRTIYGRFMETLRNFSEEFDYESSQGYRNLLYYGAQYAQQNYFGSVHISTESAQAREGLVQQGSFIGEEDNQPDEPADLSEFIGMAQCAERAAVANNLLATAGMEPTFVVGRMQLEGDPKFLHAYLVLSNNQGGKYIYDPTNPHLVFNEEDGSLVQTVPAIHTGAEPVLEGESIEASLKEYSMDESGEVEVTSERATTFTGDSFKTLGVERLPVIDL